MVWYMEHLWYVLLNVRPDSKASHLNKEQELLFRSVVCLFVCLFLRLNKQNKLRLFSSSVNLELRNSLKCSRTPSIKRSVAKAPKTTSLNFCNFDFY